MKVLLTGRMLAPTVEERLLKGKIKQEREKDQRREALRAAIFLVHLQEEVWRKLLRLRDLCQPQEDEKRKGFCRTQLTESMSDAKT